MKHEAATQIFDDIHTAELQWKRDLILCAVRNARLRTDWRMAALNDRRAMNSARTAAHNALIDAANILSRAMVKARESVKWRQTLGDDRKAIGDWACHVHAHLGILAR